MSGSHRARDRAPGDDGLHKPDRLEATFLDLGEDLGQADVQGKRMAIMVERLGCINGIRMHEKIPARARIDALIRAGQRLSRINLHGDLDVTDLDGTVLGETDIARVWMVIFTPTLVFLPEQSGGTRPVVDAAVAVMPGAFERQTTLAMVRRIRDRARDSEANFQRCFADTCDDNPEQGPWARDGAISLCRGGKTIWECSHFVARVRLTRCSRWAKRRRPCGARPQSGRTFGRAPMRGVFVPCAGATKAVPSIPGAEPAPRDLVHGALGAVAGPLTEVAGDVAAGLTVATTRSVGLGVACHVARGWSGAPFPGNVGPALTGNANVSAEARLRPIPVTSKKTFCGHRHGGLRHPRRHPPARPRLHRQGGRIPRRDDPDPSNKSRRRPAEDFCRATARVSRPWTDNQRKAD